MLQQYQPRKDWFHRYYGPRQVHTQREGREGERREGWKEGHWQEEELNNLICKQCQVPTNEDY